MSAETAPQARSFAVGDLVRPAIRRAVLMIIMCAAVFELYAYLTKFTIRSVYVHTPWMNDPYDTFVTFAVFFLPLTLLVMLVRLPLCRRNHPLPVQRARDLLRCGRLILAVVLATIVAEWVAVAVRSNRPRWGNTTAVAIGLLAMVTAVTIVAAVGVLAASRKIPPSGPEAGAPDWLGDLLLAIRLKSSRLGPWAQSADRLTRWLEKAVLVRLRRHPLVASGTLSALFGVALAVGQAVGEGIPLGQVFLFYAIVGGCTMYAFLVIGGRYLDLVRRGPRHEGLTHRLYDAVVAGCAAIPAAVAFRFSVWGAIGRRGETLDQIWALFLVAFLALACISFAVETAATHRNPAGSRQLPPAA